MDITLGQTLAAFISASLGAVLAVSIGVSHKQLCALISFAAGSLLAAAVFNILTEAYAAGRSLSPLSLFIAAASGYGLFFIISKYVFHMCPACAASHFEEQEVSHFKNVFFLLAIALTIHSAMDGIAIAVSPHMAKNMDHSIFFTIAIHKLPEGLALCALLLKSGHARNKAFIWTLVFETSTLLGWLIGHSLAEHGMAGQWLDLLMVHIAGGFIYLAVHATINEIKDHSPKLILTFFAIGFAFMAFVH
jgi:zinc transporter, ZIP family